MSAQASQIQAKHARSVSSGRWLMSRAFTMSTWCSCCPRVFMISKYLLRSVFGGRRGTNDRNAVAQEIGEMAPILIVSQLWVLVEELTDHVVALVDTRVLVGRRFGNRRRVTRRLSRYTAECLAGPGPRLIAKSITVCVVRVRAVLGEDREQQIEGREALLSVDHLVVCLTARSPSDDEVSKEVAVVTIGERVMHVSDELFDLLRPPGVVPLVDRDGVDRFVLVEELRHRSQLRIKKLWSWRRPLLQNVDEARFMTVAVGLARRRELIDDPARVRVAQEPEGGAVEPSPRPRLSTDLYWTRNISVRSAYAHAKSCGLACSRSASPNLFV